MWLDQAKELRLGGHVYVDCDCGKGKTLVINHRNDAYTAYCFRCDRKEYHKKGQLSIAEIAALKKLNEEAEAFVSDIELPKDFTNDIPLEGRLWLYRASISESLIKKYRIGYSESLKRVILPVYRYNKLVWFIGRAVHTGQKPKYIAPSEATHGIIFKSGVAKKTVVVTEDILSAIRVGEITPAYSLLGTKLSTHQAKELMDFTVVLWLDSDLAGRNATNKMEKALGLVTDVYRVVTKKDPKMLTRQEIRDVLTPVWEQISKEVV